MGTITLSTIVLLLFVSLASWLGGWLLLLRSAWTMRSLYTWASCGAGLLTALTVLELLPRSMGGGDATYTVVVLLGFLLYFVTDILLQRGRQQPVPIVGLLTGLVVHSLLEGMSLAASFQLDQALGFTLLAAMLVHKLPDGMTVASLVLASTGQRGKALLGSGAIGLATLLGGLGMFAAGEWLTLARLRFVFALTTGIFLYLSFCHLVPFVLRSGEHRFPLAFLGGVLLYMLFLLFFPFHRHV